MSEEEKLNLKDWAEDLYDGVLDMLELTLELQDDEGDTGWEWIFLMSLLADKAAAYVKKGHRSPKLNEKQRMRLAAAYTSFLRAFLAGRNDYISLMSSSGYKKLEKHIELVREVLLLMPGHQDIMSMLPADLNPANEGKVDELTMHKTDDYDIVVSLPADSGVQRRDRVEKRLSEELSDKSILVVIGDQESTKVQLRDENDDMVVNTAINDILHIGS